MKSLWTDKEANKYRGDLATRVVVVIPRLKPKKKIFLATR